ncbi:MAG TPA: flagellar biosynthesis protein FliQ [Alphaproteobacteria bacterium]|nr:flagellar biosynthesis protein FliQ [Alphaproteobacteria bacterium]
MNAVEAIEIGREAVWVMLEMSMPLLLVSLVIGLVISLFQALTQIQEQTLTFVPKLVAIFIAMVALLPFMLTTLVGFTEGLADRIIGMGP